MVHESRAGLVAVFVPLATIIAGCGAGKPVAAAPIPSTFDVRVSAGSPVAGAIVTAYAISNATGEIDTAAGAGGVLGSAGPTDSGGRATVSLRGYSGPVQIVASEPALFYTDPTSPPDTSGAPPTVQVPSSFAFSSYVAKFKGEPAIVPVTLLTTLADHAALAYARGLHFAHRARTTITEALAARDPLFVTHVTKAAASWDPGSLRTTVPAPVAVGSQSLVDVAFAALFDIAMNQLAKDTAARAGYGTGAGGLTAPTLLQLLEQDLDSDGRLDGVGEGGRSVRTAGSTPVVLDTEFLRKPLAVSLLTWVRNDQLNRSGISDADLASALVFKSMIEDTSDLFGSAPTEPFDPLDRTPPEIAFAVYLTRPVAAARSRPLRLNALSASNLYETCDYELLWHSFTWTYATRFGAFTYEVFLMLRSGQHLTSASEMLNGSLAVTTQGLASKALIGEPGTVFSET